MRLKKRGRAGPLTGKGDKYLTTTPSGESNKTDQSLTSAFEPNFLFFILFSIGFAFLSPRPSQGAPDNKPVVTVETLVQTDLFETLSYPAVVKAKIHATILAEADGVVRNIHVPLGQRVHLGQNILTIQQTDPIYQYAPVQVRAPVVGAISQLAVTVGARVSKGQILASVTEPRSVKLGLEIPAQDLSLLKVGMQGIFEVLGTDTTLKIRVVGVSPLVDTATGTASAELEPMEETHKIIYPGRVGRVSFKANQHQGMMLTDSALIVENSKTFVRVVREGKAIKIPVITGLRTRGKVEILSGVEIGEHIIARSSGYIREGAEVQVEEDSSSTSSL